MQGVRRAYFIGDVRQLSMAAVSVCLESLVLFIYGTQLASQFH